MRAKRFLTWFDVRRTIAENTSYGSRLPDGIVKITCFSSALEIGIQSQSDREKASSALKNWFGDWYRESEPIIQLDIDNAQLPVEFILMDNYSPSPPSIRPFWHEVAYLSENESSEQSPVSLPEACPEKPEIIAFYSFKGGVGRTLHLAAYVLALLERAREVNQGVKILVIDSDLEAPGLTYWQAHEKQQATLSFLDFLELYQYPTTSLENVFSVVAQEIKKTAKQENRSILYFLPAFLEEEDMLDTTILPENLVRNPQGAWEVGNAIYQLGKALEVDYIFVDLRAGLSEISSPLLFDPRIQRFLVTTLNDQSYKGIKLVVEKISLLAPTESQIENEDGNYYDPSLIISFLTPALKESPILGNIWFQLQSSYIQPQDDNPHSMRLHIGQTDFAQELLYINNWEDAKRKLSSTSIMSLAKQWAKGQLSSNKSSQSDHKEPAEKLTDKKLTDVKKLVEKLRDTCELYIFAENGKGEDLLITEPLKNLANHFQDTLPNVISIGAKGAGKTFNYIQLSRLKFWEKFLSKVDPDTSKEARTFIFPLLQSKTLKSPAKEITNDARQNLTETLANFTPNFSPDNLERKIIHALDQNDWNENNWLDFWIGEISLIITGNTDTLDLHELNSYLKEKNIKVIFLFDGLEDIFPEIATDDNQKKALKSLIYNLPNKLSEIRDSNLGLIVFLRRDFLQHTIKQNLQQFENLYRAYDLSWDKNSFIYLSYWLCIQSEILDANKDKLETLSIEGLQDELEKLWGKKLGTDKGKEAITSSWIFAALTDFNGRLQARDIVRFLYHAADETVKHSQDTVKHSQDNKYFKWLSSRLLPPPAIRDALKPCSEEKVKEAKEEYIAFQKWVDEKLSNKEKKIPFSIDQFDMDSETVRTLEQMGVIYEDKEQETAERYYIPEIFREGLGFSGQGARPRVLALKRKILGNL